MLFLSTVKHRPEEEQPPMGFIICHRDLDLFCRGLMGDVPCALLPPPLFFRLEHSLVFGNPFVRKRKSSNEMSSKGTRYLPFGDPFVVEENTTNLELFPRDKIQAQMLHPYGAYVKGRASIQTIDKSLLLDQDGANKVLARMRKGRNDICIPDHSRFLLELHHLYKIGMAITSSKGEYLGRQDYNVLGVFCLKAIKMCLQVLVILSWQTFARHLESNGIKYRQRIVAMMSTLLPMFLKASIAYAIGSDGVEHTCVSWHGCCSWREQDVRTFMRERVFYLYYLWKFLPVGFGMGDWEVRLEEKIDMNLWLAKGIRVVGYAKGHERIYRDERRDNLAPLGYMALSRVASLHYDLRTISETTAYFAWHDRLIEEGQPGINFGHIPENDDTEEFIATELWRLMQNGLV